LISRDKNLFKEIHYYTLNVLHILQLSMQIYGISVTTEVIELKYKKMLKLIEVQKNVYNVDKNTVEKNNININNCDSFILYRRIIYKRHI
jgi:hypothetical protein